MSRPRRTLLALASVVLAAVLCLIASPASAHGGPTSAPQAVTADLGDLQVRAVIGVASTVPGPVLIDISLTTASTSDLPLDVRAWPSNGDRPSTPDGAVRMLAGDAGPYPTQIMVDRAGPWDIELRFPDSVGPVSMVRIPITVTLPQGDPAEPGRSMFYAAAGLIAVAGVSTAFATRRRFAQVSSAALWATGPATVAVLAVAITLSVVPLDPVGRGAAGSPAAGMAQSGSTSSGSSTSPAAGQGTQGGPSHVNVTVSPLESTPVAGMPTTLEIRLSDGSSGFPVDDLMPHHEGLLHVAIMGEGAADFAHVHPARVEPGRYLIAWTPTTAGEHVVEVELARGTAASTADVGTQVIARTVQVAPGDAPASSPAEIPGLGVRDVDGLEVEVSATGPLVAGVPIGFTARVTDSGEPAALEQWLGMNGHMMVRDRRTELFAHLHAVGPMASAPVLSDIATGTGDALLDRMRVNRNESTTQQPPTRETVSAVDFAFTFPAGGRFDAWIQFRHADRVVTVPISLEVSP